MERFTHFMSGKGHFFKPDQKAATGFNGTTQKNIRDVRKTINKTLRKVVLSHNINLSNLSALDECMMIVYKLRSLTEPRGDTLGRYFSGWMLAGNIRSGIKENWQTVLVGTKSYHLCYISTYMSRKQVSQVHIPGKQDRVPFPSAILITLAKWVMGIVAQHEARIRCNLWQYKDKRDTYWKEILELRLWEVALSHTTQALMWAARSGEHCRNVSNDRHMMLDPITRRQVGKHWRLSFLQPYEQQTQLPMLMRGCLRFGQKNNNQPVISNARIPTVMYLNCFFYLYRRMGLTWSKLWYRNSAFWDAIESPRFRLVPLNMRHYKQHLIDPRKIHRKNKVETRMIPKMETCWSAVSYTEGARRMTAKFFEFHTGFEKYRYNASKSTGHSMRYEFVFQRFLELARTGHDTGSLRMRTLQAELRWSTEQMLSVYGLFKSDQMAQLQVVFMSYIRPYISLKHRSRMGGISLHVQRWSPVS